MLVHDDEGLFSLLRVTWQRAVRETTSPGLLHDVNDFAWQDQTEPGCAEDERDHGTNTCDRMARVNDQPGAPMHLPGQNRCRTLIECL